MGSGTKWPWQRGGASVAGVGGASQHVPDHWPTTKSPRQQEPAFLWDGRDVWIQEQ